MNFHKFEDLMGTEELYFRRADLFPQDDEECVPDEEYLRLIMGSDRFVLRDETELNHQIGTLSQMREMYYVSCWHLFRKEHPAMWEEFGKDGVAVCSRYAL